jgi:hypothetical protein
MPCSHIIIIVTARHLTVRDIPRPLAQALERERRRRGLSLNQTVKDLLSRALGLGPTPFENGLRDLAGTWTDDELARFEHDTAFLSDVDEEVWR